MEKPGTDKVEDLGVAETPEDVAVLYSWANVHGAKYRDFSASRREYRAQLRHRAAEQVRQQALNAKAESEAAAEAAETVALKAVAMARAQEGSTSEAVVKQSFREAEDAARTAAAERIEAARRAEAAAAAEATARIEEREIADAQALAGQQAAQYAGVERRRRASDVGGRSSEAFETSVPGEISDPYTPVATSAALPHAPSSSASGTPAPVQVVEKIAAQDVSGQHRRRQGYHPDEPSGIRKSYRGQGFQAPAFDRRSADIVRPASPVYPRMDSSMRRRDGDLLLKVQAAGGGDTGKGDGSSAGAGAGAGSGTTGSGSSSGGRRVFPPQAGSQRREESREAAEAVRPVFSSSPVESPSETPFWEKVASQDRADSLFGDHSRSTEPVPGSANPDFFSNSQVPSVLGDSVLGARPVSPFSQLSSSHEPVRGRRAHDDSQNPRVTGFSEAQAGSNSSFFSPVPSGTGSPELTESGSSAAHGKSPAGPAWFYAPPTPEMGKTVAPPPPLASVAETLQHSRERVAARWFALKGVFEQPGSEMVEAVPARQKEVRTPILAVLSLAGGVGKTSLVATVGRSLSSLGEKVLLTDTTSHGLLPFYFGASELRQGAVRTFSPPSGSTDAPIYLVSYEVGQEKSDADREKLVEEILASSRGTHRILLDLSVNSAWIIRNIARMSPKILVPLAPDMNSVISLQSIEKFFQGMVDADGRPLQPYYVINQFDVSLPLHLDVREVLRRQLGDRLMPFVIHRAPEVSEALAEGMTVVDYAPESPVSGDYMNVANWLRAVAAPAAAGFRNVRWSER
ncbi:MAG: cellulose synthase operon protein YhjQ/BcsQ [Edaphobacter sp.]|uniref:cellulose synthase operon protein YhjQ/BcsQ n=1 Tax=Edaphobacter sp. TaxID=1934404 RepID=UPI00239E8A51|nr:cellulose synthase operon protein YhjQ/BcsQ [Edaphobacter sp.]MDE1178435.1 cellulose synthase operon protein YhjQ/BcsQ [Edaphobacter sp.]